MGHSAKRRHEDEFRVESAWHHKGEFPMTQRLNYTTIAPAGTKALRGVHGYIAESGLPSSLVNLVYLRVSQINGCAYCIDMHSRDLSAQDPRTAHPAARW